jgi:hypothetical protein
MNAVASQRPTVAGAAPGSGVRPVVSIEEVAAVIEDELAIADAYAWAEGMFMRVRTASNDVERFAHNLECDL